MADPFNPDQAQRMAGYLNPGFQGSPPSSEGQHPAFNADQAARMESYLAATDPIANAETQNTHQIPTPTEQYWGPGAEVMSGALLGLGPQVGAGAYALKYGVQDLLHGVPPGQAYVNALHIYYPYAQGMYSAAQQKYMGDYPAQAEAARTVGGVAGAIPAIAAPEMALGGLARAGAEAFPEAARVLGPSAKYLLGYGGESTLGRMGSSALMGARQTAELDAMQGRAPDPAQMALGAAGNAVLSPIFHPITQGLTAEVNPTVANTAERLGQAGIDVKGGALSSKAIPGQGNVSQLAQVRAAVNRSMGAPEDQAITPANVDAQRRSIGRGLDAVGKRFGVSFWTPDSSGNTLATNLSNTISKANSDGSLVDLATGKPLDNNLARINNMRTSIEGAMGNTGHMTGDDYLNITKMNSPLGKALRDNNNPTLQDYAREIRTHLDNAFDATAQATGGQDAVDEVKSLRQQWKNSQVARLLAPDAESKGGGFVDPTQIQSKLLRVYKSGIPDNELGALSAGSRLLPRPTETGEVKPPSMGTGAKIKNAIFGHGPAAIPGGIFGAALAEHYGLPYLSEAVQSAPLNAGIGALLGGLGWAANRGIRAFANTPMYKNMLLNGGMPAESLAIPSSMTQGGINALLNPPTEGKPQQ